jgi:hypothetical protein
MTEVVDTAIAEFRAPKIIQIVAHPNGDVYALNDAGEMFARERDAKDFNQGPGSHPKFLWRKIEGPEG